MTATLTENKTFSLPEKILQKLDLHAGDQLDVDIQGNEIRVRKSSPKNTKSDFDEKITKYIGIGTFPVGKTTDEYLDFIRDR